jgi:prepilin-type N-terminal cleavage/methylation domain-containing protein
MARKITERLSNEKAFTLIEVIVSLVLAGIMAAIVGLGLVKITQGYVFAKQNSETVQKAQIAMTRIVKELGAATSISAATLPTPTSVTYTRPVSVTNTISISGGLVQMSGTISGTIINNVVTTGSFSKFEYFNATGSSVTPSATTVPTIRRIDVTLRITGANNQTSDFTNSVWINESY